MTTWALSRNWSLIDAWNLFDHAKRTRISFCLDFCSALLSECEQRGMCGHQIALLLNGLPCTSVTYDSDMGFGAATRLAAASLAARARDATLSMPSWRTRGGHEASRVIFPCAWCACCVHGMPSALDR
eukprot:gnl/TRDRNA2_/TRDRNA2_87026_c1_seq1.p1 gnl/TRDRNA2_/TRDRNA2_87026_c1~~gnl/TRDRNA2_/TRDRNA2_87026_c1_seq1.p1  ORF type:complete len:128 (-),score=9.60 gnl/TRDRNA2_/TRDRNA2_87026_c1_seq1:176-559(-)